MNDETVSFPVAEEAAKKPRRRRGGSRRHKRPGGENSGASFTKASEVKPVAEPLPPLPPLVVSPSASPSMSLAPAPPQPTSIEPGRTPAFGAAARRLPAVHLPGLPAALRPRAVWLYGPGLLVAQADR